IKVPDIGDVSEVDVIEVLVSEGDTIQAEQSLITVESDKASMEIPSPGAGVVKALKVGVGDKVSEGTVILELDEQAETAPDAGKQSEASTATTDTGQASAAASAPAADNAGASPAQQTSGQSGQAKKASSG